MSKTETMNKDRSYCTEEPGIANLIREPGIAQSYSFKPSFLLLFLWVYIHRLYQLHETISHVYIQYITITLTICHYLSKTHKGALDALSRRFAATSQLHSNYVLVRIIREKYACLQTYVC